MFELISYRRMFSPDYCKITQRRRVTPQRTGRWLRIGSLVFDAKTLEQTKGSKSRAYNHVLLEVPHA